MSTDEPLSIRLVGRLRALDAARTDEVTGFALQHITDTLPIAHAASATDSGGRVVRAATRGMNGGSSRVVGLPVTASPATGAFANAALAHLLDFDDIHDDARLHPTTVAFPAALASAELAGADGDAVVRGTLLGAELVCHLGLAVRPDGTGRSAHWFLTQVLGYLGAAVAAGVVLGLSDGELVAALGLAALQAAGSKQTASATGATARSIYPAFAASGGVTAALLAAEGVIGPGDALDGPDGLLPVYLGVAELPGLWHDPTRWRYLGTSLKPWPCCRISHPYVAAAIALHDRLAADGRNLHTITRIALSVNASSAKLCHPLSQRRRPTTVEDAKYSIPFMTAHALVHGTVDLASTSGAWLGDRRVRALAGRIEVDECLANRPGHAPARIQTVDDHDQRACDAYAEQSQLDLTPAAARQKVVACLQHSSEPDAAAQRLIAAVAALPHLAAAEFGALFQPDPLA